MVHVIKSTAGRNFIYRSFLKPKQVIKAIEFSEKYLINIALCHTEAIYYTEQNSVIPKLMDKFGATYKEVNSYDDLTTKTLEIVFAGDNRRTVEFIRDKFSFPVFGWEFHFPFLNLKLTMEFIILKLRRSGSSKGKALHRLLKYLKIKEERTVVVGDWYNDISLFDTKAIKVAPKNAIPELKKKADYILKTTNNEEAIADFLEALLKAKMN